MATNPTAGLSDPAILRKTEAQLAKAAVVANGKPTVSGSELILPSTTVRTTANTVITTTSANNDPGDTVTVYTAPQGGVYVSSIDQTVRQTVVNNPIAGVSSIIAGGNVSISSTGAGGTGDVTISASLSGVGNIAVLNLDGNASNVLHGDGSWSADTTTYGNSNVVSLLSSFGSNTITTTGNVSVGNIIGNGQALTGLTGANVTGAVPYATTANAVAVTNVSGIGNIATVDLDGNVSNVLAGDGTWVAMTGGGASLGNLEVTDTTITVVGGASQNSILVGNGPAGLTLGLNNVGPAYLNLYANTYDSQSYSTGSGYTTGTYTASVGGGTITLTDATLIETYLNSISKPATITSLVINGTDTVPYDGASYGGGTVNLFTTTAPGVDPTDVTSILFNITYQNQFLIDEDNGDYGIYLGDLNFDIQSTRDVNITAGDDLRLESNDIFSLTNNGDISFTTNANSSSFSWAFHNTGVTYFPTLTVDLHNGGNQSGQVLQFGDTTQQVIITGPTPGVDTNAQRLIIQGQRASGVGEGGDVYFWAGDADNYGGDIKIYAGDADNVSAGYGGYVNIEGGSGFDEGGYVRMTGGQSSNGAGATASVIGGYGNTSGGDANLQGGQGTVAGGNVNLTAGYGSGGPGGNVTIVAGGSANGLTDYGNINLSAGASSWVFGRDGNLTLPSNDFTVNYANGTQVSIGGAAAIGNVTFDDVTIQGVNQLNLSAGPDYTANSAYLQLRAGDVASHIHLDTGDNAAYDLIIGDDSKHVQVSSTGNIIMRSYDSANGLGYTATLDTTGNLIVPGNIASSNDVGIYNLTSTTSGTQEGGSVGGPGAQTFTAQVSYFPTVGDIQVGWTVTGNNLSGTTTVTNVNEYSPGFFEITTDTGVTDPFWYGDTYTFTSDVGTTGFTFTTTGNLVSPSGNITFDPNNDYLYITTVNGAEFYMADASLNTGSIGIEGGAAWINVGYDGDEKIWNFLANGAMILPGNQISFDPGGDFLAINTLNGAELSMFDGGSNAASISVGAGNVVIAVNNGGGDKIWSFGADGNLTLPSNDFTINYANGTQVSLGGASISNGTSNVNIASSGGNVTVSVGGTSNVIVATTTGANVTGTLTTTDKIGYLNGGSATQASSGSSVTVNQLTGIVTMAKNSWTAGDIEFMLLNCNKVDDDDFIMVQCVGSTYAPSFNVTAYPYTVVPNTIAVWVRALDTLSDTSGPKIQFFIMKAPTS